MQKGKLSVFLYGAWKNNLGDDLFLKAITQRYPDIIFHVLANKQYADSYPDITNLVVHIKNGRVTRALNALYRKLKKPDYIFKKMAKQSSAVILLGGSLYQQEDNWVKLYNQRRKMISLFDASFAIGNNFGPSKDQKFIDNYKQFFQELTDVCFRDKESQAFFPYDNVRSASDVVFGIGSYLSVNKSNQNSLRISKPYVVVSVIDLNYKSVSRKYNNVTPEIYEAWISKLINCLEERGYNVVLMGFCTSEGDHYAIDRILESNSFKNTTKFIHHSIDESMDVLSGAEMVVATRFHAMILGWTLEKKVLPIVYGNKMRQVINDTGFDGCCVDIEEIDKYEPQYVIDQAKQLDNISKYREDSFNQFSGFDSWLKQQKDG